MRITPRRDELEPEHPRPVLQLLPELDLLQDMPGGESPVIPDEELLLGPVLVPGDVRIDHLMREPPVEAPHTLLVDRVAGFFVKSCCIRHSDEVGSGLVGEREEPKWGDGSAVHVRPNGFLEHGG